MAIAAAKRQPFSGRLTYPFLVTAAQVLTEGQLVEFGADADTVTGTTTNTGIKVMGRITQDVAAADTGPTGKRFDVELLFHKIEVFIASGAIAAGAWVVCDNTTGKVSASGATPDARSVLGMALNAAVNSGDLIPVGVRL